MLAQPRLARLDPTPSFLPELLAFRKLLGLTDLHGSREDFSIFSNDLIFSKRIPAKNYFWYDSIFSKRIPAKNYFRHDSIFVKRIPAKNTTFGMIFRKSPQNGDLEFWLAGPKFHQIFKPIRLVTSQ